MSSKQGQTVPASPVSGKLFSGQSLKEEIDQLSEKGLIPFFIFTIAFWLVCGAEWTQRIAGANPDPRFWTVLSLLITVYGGVQIFRLRPKLRRLHQGERSEGKNIVPILDRMRAHGFIAFHDLSQGGVKTDHVMVGPSGIYVIETKTRSLFGSGSIDYRGENDLMLGGRISDSKPLGQARDSARALRLHLEEHLRARYSVHPVVVFVGDWKVQQDAADFDVTVLATRELENFFEQQQPELTRSEIAQICAHLQTTAPG